MARPQEESVNRKSLLEAIRRSKAEEFEELTKKDLMLATQTILDPIGTLSRFGLIEAGDNDLYMQVTKGSLRDIAYLREAVAARGGLASFRRAGAAEKVGAVRISVCVTFTWGPFVITVCVELEFE